MNKFKAATNDEIERLKNQLKWQVSELWPVINIDTWGRWLFIGIDADNSC